MVTNTDVKSVLTHDGLFHADEVFANAVLDLIVNNRRLDHPCDDAVHRTRDTKKLDDALADPEVAVVDVGGVYDPDMNNFDHHQREEKPEPRENGVPYSSFGLVWKKYGAEFVYSLIYDDLPEGSDGVKLAKEIQLAVDESVVQGIDAIDCGALEHHSVIKGSSTKVRLTSISGVIGSMNPRGDADEIERYDAFLDAVLFADRFLDNEVYRASERIVWAGEAVRKGYDKGKRIVVLDRFVPWQEAVVNSTSALYCVFPTVTGAYNVQQVPASLGSFDGRKPLPEKWRGLRSEELSKLTGVEDAIFCHNTGFVCGADSLEGAIALAELAVAS